MQYEKKKKIQKVEKYKEIVKNNIRQYENDQNQSNKIISR